MNYFDEFRQKYPWSKDYSELDIISLTAEATGEPVAEVARRAGYTPDTGFSASLASGLNRYGAGFASVLDYATRPVEGALNNEGAFGVDWGAKARGLNETAAIRDAMNPDAQVTLDNMRGIGDAVDWTSHLAAGSAPYLAEAVATGGLGSALVRNTAGAAGRTMLRQGVREAGNTAAGRALARSAANEAAGKISQRAATAGVVAGSYPSSLGLLLDRQREEGSGYDSSAMLGAIPYAGLNALGVEGLAARMMGPAAQGGRGLLRRMGASGLRTMGEESVAELGQSIDERVVAGLPLTDAGAMREYRDAAVGGGVLGGILGPAGGLRRDAPSRASLQAALEAARQRVEAFRRAEASAEAAAQQAQQSGDVQEAALATEVVRQVSQARVAAEQQLAALEQEAASEGGVTPAPATAPAPVETPAPVSAAPVTTPAPTQPEAPAPLDIKADHARIQKQYSLDKVGRHLTNVVREAEGLRDAGTIAEEGLTAVVNHASTKPKVADLRKTLNDAIVATRQERLQPKGGKNAKPKQKPGRRGVSANVAGATASGGGVAQPATDTAPAAPIANTEVAGLDIAANEITATPVASQNTPAGDAQTAPSKRKPRSVKQAPAQVKDSAAGEVQTEGVTDAGSTQTTAQRATPPSAGVSRILRAPRMGEEGVRAAPASAPVQERPVSAVQPDRTKKAPQKPAVRTPSGDATRQSLLSRARKLANSADEDIAYQAKEIIRALKNDKITAEELEEQAESLRILEGREEKSADPPAPAASARATKSRKEAEQDVAREMEDEDLSAWEADAAHDATDAVEEARARNEGTEPDYSETDPASRAASDAVRTALGKRYGERTIAALINKGLLRIHASGRAAQKALRSDNARMRGSQGFFDGKVIHLIAGNMTAEHAPSVLAHEFLHKYLKGLEGTPRYKALMRQLANLERAAKGGEVGAWFRKASARVQIADSADADRRLNETAAYAVEEYTRAPQSLPQAIVKWVRNFIANVRTFLMARGIPIGRLTEADLAAMSIRLLYEDAGAVASDGRANAGDTRYSEAEDDAHFVERARSADEDVRSELARATDNAKALELLARDTSARVRQRAAENPHLPPTLQVLLARDGNLLVRERLLDYQRPLTPAAQAVLAKDERAEIREVLARAKNLSDDVLSTLAGDRNITVRHAVAGRADISPQLQERLAQDDHDHVRQALAANPQLTPRVQRVLAEDANLPVRANIAQNPNLTSESQRVVAQDAHAFVRGALAKNPNLEPATQRVLVEDDNETVRRNLGFNPAVVDDVQLALARDESERVREGLVTLPRLSARVLDALAPHLDVRALVRLFDAGHFSPVLNARAAALLKAAQTRPDTNAHDIAALIGTGRINLADIKDVARTGVTRWRRELKRILDATTDADNKLTATARKLGAQKDALIAMLRKSLGDDVAKDWAKRDYFSRAALETAAGEPGLLYLAETERGGMQAPGIDQKDSALSFFNPDIAEWIQRKFSFYMGSDHPAGFGFSLFRRFGKNDENAMLTEIQSDVMSYLFDKDKAADAEYIWGEDLEAAREALRPRIKLWPKEIFRNTVRYLFAHGVKKVYAITPTSLERDLRAHPPMSVVNAWQGEREARAEGFGERTHVEVGGREYEVWDAIDRDSEAGQDILFSERTVLTDNDMNTAFTLLALHDDAFQQVTPKGKTLQRVVEEIDPGYKVTSFNPGRDADRGWVLITPSGAEGYVYERGGKVWIDVSDLTPGKDSGSLIYGMVAGYAHNTKKTFVGDPMGLSEKGFYRRLENMISSTLRYGTTDHLAPHDYQVHTKGRYINNDAEFEGLELDWKPGDTAHNLASMLRVAYNAALRNTPGIKDFIYDFGKQAFVDTRTGDSVSRKGLGAAVRVHAGKTSPSYTGGSATAARAVLYHTLLQGRGTKGWASGLVVAGGERRLGVDPELERIFYSEPEESSSETDDLQYSDPLESAATWLDTNGHADAAEALRRQNDTVRDWARKAFGFLAFTSTIARRAAELGMTYAIPAIEAVRRRETVRIRMDEKGAELMRRLNRLDRGDLTRKRSSEVRQFLLDMTRDMTRNHTVFVTGGAYTWIPANTPVDAAAHARYMALSPEQRGIVDDTFAGFHEHREERNKFLRRNINEATDDAIDMWKNSNSPDAAARIQELEDSRRAALKLLAKPPILLYAPMQRVGSHAVVAKSQALLDAEANATPDVVRRLQEDPAHYFVAFRSTFAAAKALERQVQQQNPNLISIDTFEREKLAEQIMLPAVFQAIADRIDASGGPAALAMKSLLTEMYIEDLADDNARKSDLHRDNVPGMDADAMEQSIAQRWASDAREIAALAEGKAEREVWQKLREEANEDGYRETRLPYYNALVGRRAGVMKDFGAITGKVLKATSVMKLVTKPAYYVYNATQPFLMTHPYLARNHGFGGALDAMKRAYADVWGTQKGAKGVAARILALADISGLPADVRAIIQALADQGRIDITISQDLGSHIIPRFDANGNPIVQRGKRLVAFLDDVFNTTMQKSEMVNRMVTGIAAYRLEKAARLKAGMSEADAHEAALRYAGDAIDMTQGDYSQFNAPALINVNGATRVMFQFGKFRLIQITYVAHMFKEAFLKSGLTSAEKTAARRAFALVFLNHLLLGGAVGLPGIGVVLGLYSALLGDDDDPRDLEVDIREALGDGVLANLLTRGVPSLAGIDMTKNVGAGDMFSLMPYTEVSGKDKKSADATFVGAAGPFVGVLRDAYVGVNEMMDGNVLRGSERFMPSGVSAVSRALRELTGGITKRNGDVLLPAEDIHFGNALVTALGFRTTKQSDTSNAASKEYKVKSAWSEETTRIRRDYTSAYRSRDFEAMSEAREKWAALQAKKVRQGAKASPLSNLLRAPHEK